MSFLQQVTTTYKETRSPEEMKEMMELALRGLHLLSEWTSIVTELYSVCSFKVVMLRPTFNLSKLSNLVETSASYRSSSKQRLPSRSRGIRTRKCYNALSFSI